MQYEARDTREDQMSYKLRARLGVDVLIEPEIKAVMRLATTRSHRSTNQTLGDPSEPGSSRRYFGLDLAYADWTPTLYEEWLKSKPIRVVIGRIPQVHLRPGGSQILLDEDIALEGAAVITQAPLGGGFTVFVNGGSTWIRENYDTYYSVRNAENMLNWAQAVLQFQHEDHKGRLGHGFFNYTSVKGMSFSDLAVGGATFGNSEKPAGTVKNEFLVRQLFAEYSLMIGTLESSVFLEHTYNSSTSDPNRAWWMGLSFARAKDWDLQLAYGSLESDAVLGVFTNSDFANGTVDSNGYMLSGRWFINPSLQLRITQFMNRLEATKRDLGYARTHVDLSASF